MEKVKVSFELDKDVYESLKKQYEEISSKLGDKIKTTTFDEYIQSIIVSFSKSGEQMKKMGSKLNEMFDKLGGFSGMDLGDIDLDAFLGGLSGNMKQTKDDKKKPDPPKNTNLKN